MVWCWVREIRRAVQDAIDGACASCELCVLRLGCTPVCAHWQQGAEGGAVCACERGPPIRVSNVCPSEGGRTFGWTRRLRGGECAHSEACGCGPLRPTCAQDGERSLGLLHWRGRGTAIGSHRGAGSGSGSRSALAAHSGGGSRHEAGSVAGVCTRVIGAWGVPTRYWPLNSATTANPARRPPRPILRCPRHRLRRRFSLCTRSRPPPRHAHDPAAGRAGRPTTRTNRRPPTRPHH